MDQLKNLLLQIETPLITSFAKTLGSYEELFVSDVRNVLKDFYTNLDIISTNVKDPSIVFCLYIALINCFCWFLSSFICSLLRNTILYLYTKFSNLILN